MACMGWRLTIALGLGLSVLAARAADAGIDPDSADHAQPPTDGLAPSETATPPQESSPPAESAGRPAEPGEPAAKRHDDGERRAAPQESPRAQEPRKPASHGSQNRNRLLYVVTQAPLSIYVYGLSIPLALDFGNAKLAIATPLIVAPFAFGAHFWISNRVEFQESHLRGTNYLSIASLYLSHALPFAIMNLNTLDDVADAFRVSSFISLAAYPAGIWAGYLLGDQYVDAPGRIQTQAHFASAFGMLGFFSPFLYFERPNDHLGDIFHLGLGQSIGMAVAGHFLASFSHEGQNIPEGVTSGIVTHGSLGAGLGLTAAAIGDASTARPWMGMALAGGTLGVMEGLFYFRNRYDTQERAFFNLLGTGAGALMGGGALILAFDKDASAHSQKILFTSLIAGGAVLGYAVTDILTRGMEDRRAAVPAEEKSWSDHVALNLVPFLEPQVRDQQIYYRYRIPGLSLTF
jgi:hypothetical protein